MPGNQPRQKERRKLAIRRDFHSLDAIACERALSLIEETQQITPVELSREAQASLQKIKSTQIPTEETKIKTERNEGQQTAVVEDTPASILQDLRILFRPYHLLFLLPAALLAFLGAITGFPVAESVKLLLLLVCGLIAIVLSVALGRGVESGVRKWGLTEHLKNLSKRDASGADLFQRFSRDFVTLNERIATAKGFNLFLENFANATATSGAPGVAFLERKKRGFSWQGMNALYRATLDSLATKNFFSNCAGFFSGLLISGIVAYAVVFAVHASYMIFLLTALIVVDGNVIRFFLALSGFNSQRISIHRLSDATLPNLSVWSGVVAERDRFFVPAFRNEELGMGYNSLSFAKGRVYTLTGASGSGKSQYLKNVAGFGKNRAGGSGAGVERAVYLDAEFLEIYRWVYAEHENAIVSFVDLEIEAGCRFFIFDETSNYLDKGQAFELVQRCGDSIRKAGGCLVLVDHRFEVGEVVSIVDVVRQGE